jgi:hypothetical protein
MTRQDQIIAVIRHAVPALVGAFLAFLIERIPVIASGIQGIDMELAALGLAGVSVSVVLQAIAVGGVSTLYYWIARQAGARWPAAEKWLLGNSSTPIYRWPETPVSKPAAAPAEREYGS